MPPSAAPWRSAVRAASSHRAPLRGREIEQADDRVMRDPDADRIRLPRMRLDQHADALPLGPVLLREPRRTGRHREARRRIVVADERRIEVERQRALRRQPLHQAVAQADGGLAQRLVADQRRRDVERHVVLELRAVGDVQVGVDDRIPLVQQAQHRLHLGGVGLHVVAIEVQVLAGDAPADLLGADLVGTIGPAHPLVPVDVEHRHEHQRDASEDAGRDASFEQLAKRQEAGVLAVDLAGVDAALREHHGPALGLGRRRGQRPVRGRHQHQHGAAFRRPAELDAAHLLRPGCREGRAQPLDFVVAAGAHVVGLLRDGAEIGRSGGLRAQERERADQHVHQQVGHRARL